ncbi:peptidoglycan/LPS O-acetylase OafA/YrhL [Nonlabens dokdonensis]|uniref:Acyltransferase n=2 Tax=Nonlabens dokdonensis TaxID=328515 RepID=L7WFL4_NONDD|nr:acyltransferase [Nonlabens dokdonensis]AGC77698.1 acyltransferase [Nonlabens dokdonensis DSW-6]PZX39765.1 peptidoglycan/LPS O-acetylase OafA/YrhL [Nonlabens dokdonensis]
MSHLKPLTSLRFLFALMVFVSHLNFLKISSNEFLKDLYNQVLIHGYIGVSFFFILSGFILTHVYRDKINTNKKENKKYFLARLARVYPLHFATFIIAIPLMFWGQEINGKGILLGLSNVSLTQAYLPIKEFFFSFNGPSWSISCELFFYLCFPFLLKFLSRKKLLKYIISLLLIVAIIVLPLFIDKELHHGLFYINPIFRLVDFILGIILYDLYVLSLKRKKQVNFAWLEFLAIGVFILFFSFRNSVMETYLYSSYYWIPMIGIIYVFAFQQGVLSRLLSYRLAIWLGEISFGFYMVHHLVLRYFTLGNGRFNIFSNDLTIIILLLFLSILGAFISHKYFEIPMNKWIRNKWN